MIKPVDYHPIQTNKSYNNLHQSHELTRMQRGFNASFSDLKNEPVHEFSNNVVCETSKASDQPAHTRSLMRAFACLLSIL